MSNLKEVRELTPGDIGKTIKLTVRGVTAEGALTEIYTGTRVTREGVQSTYSIKIGDAIASGFMVSSNHEIEIQS